VLAVQPPGGKLGDDLEHLIRETADVEDVISLERLSADRRHQP
jgi:hypothetical protein